jgi:hypothetical protein
LEALAVVALSQARMAAVVRAAMVVDPTVELAATLAAQAVTSQAAEADQVFIQLAVLADLAGEGAEAPIRLAVRGASGAVGEECLPGLEEAAALVVEAVGVMLVRTSPASVASVAEMVEMACLNFRMVGVVVPAWAGPYSSCKGPA